MPIEKYQWPYLIKSWFPRIKFIWGFQIMMAKQFQVCKLQVCTSCTKACILFELCLEIFLLPCCTLKATWSFSLHPHRSYSSLIGKIFLYWKSLLCGTIFWDNENDQSSSQLTYLALELYVSDNWVFPERFTESIQLDSKEHFGATGSSACCSLPSAQNASVEHHSIQTPDHQRKKKEVFTFSSKPRSAPYGKSPNVSLESDVFPLELELDSNRDLEKTETEDSFEGSDSSEEVGHFVH